jgi:hypothetical protein
MANIRATFESPVCFFNNERIMKKLFAMVVLICAGCSQPTPQYSDVYAQPGIYAGSWKQGAINYPCTTNLEEADTALKASIVNDTTKEVLTLSGLPFLMQFYSGEQSSYTFIVRDSSSFYGDTDNFLRDYPNVNSAISVNADTFSYIVKRGNDTLSILCTRVE